MALEHINTDTVGIKSFIKRAGKKVTDHVSPRCRQHQSNTLLPRRASKPFGVFKKRTLVFFIRWTVLCGLAVYWYFCWNLKCFCLYFRCSLFGLVQLSHCAVPRNLHSFILGDNYFNNIFFLNRLALLYHLFPPDSSSSIC